MEKYKVEIRVKQYNVGTPPMTITTNYLCQDVVGGLSDLETVLEFDEDWFGFQYSYSNTTLKFCKRDKAFLLQYITGLNYWSGGVLQQDFSYSLNYLPEVKITEIATNTVIIQAHLDLNTLKIHPDYFEIALIDNATLKSDLEKDISYSLQEIDGLVKPALTDWYQGNYIQEQVILTSETFLDPSWGINWGLPASTMLRKGNEWRFNGGNQYKTCFPSTLLDMQGQGKVFAAGEYWGGIGGLTSQWTAYNQGNFFNSYQLNKVGGFTLPAGMPDTAKVRLKVNFSLLRKKIICKYLKDVNNKWKLIAFGASLGNLSLYMRLTDGVFGQFDVKICDIPKIFEEFSNTVPNFEERREKYGLENFEYWFQPNQYFGSSTIKYGVFYLKSDTEIDQANMNYTFGNDYNVCVCDFQAEEVVAAETGNYKPIEPKFSCTIEVTTMDIANSIQNKKNDLFGIPMLDYLNFIAAKANVTLDTSFLATYGLNKILYSSENLVNYTKRKNDEKENYMSITENVSVFTILNWLNNQFCLSMYVLNGVLVIKPRINTYTDFSNVANLMNIKPNRIIELSVQQPYKSIKVGSKHYEVGFYATAEAFNMEAAFDSDIQATAGTKNLKCDICTNPQMIDWLLVEAPTGDEKFLIETKEDSGDYYVYAYGNFKIAVNKNTNYAGNEAYPTLQNWQSRHWCNAFLSPLAQWERWRKFLLTLPANKKYSLIQNDNQYINIEDGIWEVEPYQKINRNDDGIAIWNNSTIAVQGLTAGAKTKLQIRDVAQTQYLSPIRLKIETPIYKEFVGNVPAQTCRFQYNGKMLQGIPIAIHTYFDKKVQEIDLILLNTNFSITDLFN